jgi:prephenate dehydrogenase
VFRRLAIVGLGLMGGAVGLAARRTGAALRVCGVTDQNATIERARLMGAVDEATLDLREGVRDADFVLLAVPVHLVPRMAQTITPIVRPGTVLTDVGSTKHHVVAAVEQLLAREKSPVHFVGSHPLAGSEKAGLEAAPQVRLANATCILTPTQATDNDAYHRVEEFWQNLEMKTMRLSPEEHDAVLARSSHLPHLLSFVLVQAQSDRSMNLCGPGLRDMTRLAGSDVGMWTDILMQNAGEMGKVAKGMGNELLQLASEFEALAAGGGTDAARERLFRYLADARQRHDQRFRKPAATTSISPPPA